MKKNSRGFSLVELMIAVGGMAGVALVVMQLSKNTAQTQVNAFNTADYFDLRTQVESMLINDFDCQASFKGLVFKASILKTTPMDVEIWHGDQNGARTTKFLSGTDAAFKKYGKIGISTVQILMPDYTGTSNFPQGNDEVFKMNLTITGDKVSMGKASGFTPITKQINIVFDTDSSGNSTIKSCNASVAGGTANFNTPPEMTGTNYCILAKTCPSGWVDNGTAGIIANYGDNAFNKCSSLFSGGSDYNGTWGWCHPRLCCNH